MIKAILAIVIHILILPIVLIRGGLNEQNDRGVKSVLTVIGGMLVRRWRNERD